MKKLIMVLALIVAGTSPAPALTTPEARAWDDACELLEHEYGYSCIGIPQPEVEYEDLGISLLGYYSGGDTIHVHRDLRGAERIAVLVHEMVHYYDAKSGRAELPGGTYDVCPSEERAFHIEGRWWINHGERDRDRSRDWWKMYPHCEPLYFQPIVVTK